MEFVKEGVTCGYPDAVLFLGRKKAACAAKNLKKVGDTRLELVTSTMST